MSHLSTVYARNNPLQPRLQRVLGLSRSTETRQFTVFLTDHVDGSDDDASDRFPTT